MYLIVALLILIAKVQQIFLFLQRNMEKDTYLYKKIKTIVKRTFLSCISICFFINLKETEKTMTNHMGKYVIKFVVELMISYFHISLW